MKIKDSVVFVTGANRGFGLALVRELIARGARKVYAGMRKPVDLDIPGVVAVKIDVTNPDEVSKAALACADTTLLINNAGIARLIDYSEPASIDFAREMFETNYYGMIRVTQAFTPLLTKNGGGAILNVLSVASWISNAALAPYAATKSAAWSYTNALRSSVRESAIQVLGLHVGFMDTDLVRDIDLPKTDPKIVVAKTLDALEAGKEEVLGDELTQHVKQGLSADPAVYLAPIRR